jgi:hypothetical protein
MSSGFPLYDNLISQISKKDLTVKQKEEFIKNVKIIDINGKELIYSLIYIFFSQNVDVNVDNKIIPYNGTNEQTNDKKSLSNITWNFMDFPVKLRQLLYNFMNLHNKTIQEDVTRTTLA